MKFISHTPSTYFSSTKQKGVVFDGLSTRSGDLPGKLIDNRNEFVIDTLTYDIGWTPFQWKCLYREGEKGRGNKWFTFPFICRPQNKMINYLMSRRKHYSLTLNIFLILFWSPPPQFLFYTIPLMYVCLAHIKATMSK